MKMRTRNARCADAVFMQLSHLALHFRRLFRESGRALLVHVLCVGFQMHCLNTAVPVPVLGMGPQMYCLQTTGQARTFNPDPLKDPPPRTIPGLYYWTVF